MYLCFFREKKAFLKGSGLWLKFSIFASDIIYNVNLFILFMKYPTGIQSFDRIIEDGYVYVDKMDMVYSIAKDGFYLGFLVVREVSGRVCWFLR